MKVPRRRWNPGCLSLYLVTDREATRGRDLIDCVEEAVAGGVTLVQLREKSLGGRAFAELGRALMRVLEPHGVPLIVNDRVDVARAIGAAGIHVGQSDLSVSDVRRVIGPEAIVGLTVESFEELAAVDAAEVDYLGASVFSTTTKTDVAGVFGLDGMRRLVELSPVPVVAIGGIHAGNAADVAATGVSGIAVVTAILAADSPAQAAGALSRSLRGRNV
jgi:thiamine-phosphate pyrophosphorylase